MRLVGWGDRGIGTGLHLGLPEGEEGGRIKYNFGIYILVCMFYIHNLVYISMHVFTYVHNLVYISMHILHT